MKTIITLMIATVVSLNAFADGGSKKQPEKYCAKVRDGVKVVMYEGTPITSDVTLTSGTIIHVDGTMVKADGTKATLQEGECIDKDGIIAKEKNKLLFLFRKTR